MLYFFLTNYLDLEIYLSISPYCELLSLKKGVFQIIELEIILGEYYNIKNSFLDIEKNLIKNNYRLLATDRLINFFSNKYMYFNAIYIKQSLYKKLIKK